MLLSFLGISQSLPSTSYIKLIDIWMIFTMIYPFAETVLVCLKDAVKEKTVVVKGENIDTELLTINLNTQFDLLLYLFNFLIYCIVADELFSGF